MHVKHPALLKLKHAALFLIMQLVLGLIMLRVSIMLRVDLARFSHTVSLQYFSLGIR